jgi:hypothetical protein
MPPLYMLTRPTQSCIGASPSASKPLRNETLTPA